ncbi:alpha/beta hydrolase [Mycobacterium sp. CVI_P3]|uniref:Alpha/beta hydrolase n=1 Tax=Mycobacterium pinniadriaticum TaxID=2994102 RepID=A0ABT3SG61_9MYCO|nr:alpha/beta hydrolase [Mycobacterium pinniadriaticum]MCX2931461.1 alpha/beta hydrolase [Mycobacterium pinniadriaticum]MCX2937885.1 alpha/beta hydrolase [Mycobacterium pinniadriaticum]
MSSPIEQVTARCTRAYHTGSLLLRGSPAAAGWLLGWLSAEFAPHVLTGHALSAVPSPLEKIACALAVQKADTVLDSALQETFGEDYTAAVRHPLEPYTARRPNLAAVVEAMRHRGRYAATTRNISYGPGGGNHLLDIWRRPDLPKGGRAPVLIHVPGGGWSVNDKRGQGYPLMTRMSELGWICVSINYSRSPRNAFPTHIVDVKRAIAWVKANIAAYGGDPDFVAITGGSAGGHLASLAALSSGDPALQPGFEAADTSVQAAAPYYGVYDLTNADNMHPLMMPLLEHVVMQRRLADDPQLYRDASPMHRIHRGAPPFFVLHGENDAVIPSSQARAFTTALRKSGSRTVSYAELPNAHHAFDTIATLRCQLAAEAVASFLGIIYGRHVAVGKRIRRAAVSSAS